MPDKRFTQFYFTQQEHVTSTKWNNILDVIEESRRLYGPISVGRCASGVFNATGYFLELTESPKYIGGITVSGADNVTRARFEIIHQTPSDTPNGDSYVRWKNVLFVSGGASMGNAWYATLSSGVYMPYGYLDSGAIGGGDLNLSGSSITGYTCIRQPD